MSIKQQIRSQLNSNINKAVAPLKVDIKTIATPQAVEDIIYNDAQIMLNKAKANLSKIVNSSAMVNSLKIFKGKANYSVTLGADYKYYNAFMLNWHEYGTVDRYRRSSKKSGSRKGANISTGKIRSQPFMRPAFEQTKKTVFDTIQKDIIKLIEISLNKKLK